MANWLDNTVSWFSPQRGLKRAAARAVLSHIGTKRRLYEGADLGRHTDGWIPLSGDVNSDITAGAERLRNRARDLVRNNPWAAQGLRALVTNIIGSGIVPQADPRTDQMWYEWCIQCDAEGHTDFYGLQSLIVRTMIEAGSCLVQRVVGVEGMDVPLQLRVLEPDYLDVIRLDPQNPNAYVQQGIEFDEAGRRLGYWIYRVHPGATNPFLGKRYAPRESVFVPARDILHIFDRIRPGQLDGVTWFAPAIMRLYDVDTYEKAELMRKKIESCLAAFVITNEDATPLGIPTTDEEGKRIEAFEPGMIEYLPGGKDVRISQPAAAGGYGEYIRAQLHAVASALGVTYEMMTGDLKEVSFISGRLGLQEFRRRVDQIQMQILVPQLLLPVWQWWTDIAQTVQVLDGRRKRIDVKWSMPRYVPIEPLAEAQADALRLRNGTISLPEVIAQYGYDFEDMINDIVHSNEVLDENDILLDSDPRKMTKQGTIQKDPNVPQPVAAPVAAPVPEGRQEELPLHHPDYLKGNGHA